MRTAFDEQLDQLFVDLSRLAMSANESLVKAMKAYNTDDKDLAHELFSDDLRINAATIDIEQKAYRVIALQQPVARDLRKVFTVLQASTDIERFADHAVIIARSSIRRDEDHEVIEEIDQWLNEMADCVSEMLQEAIKAIITRDSELARNTAASDRRVDELFKQVIEEITRRMNHSTGVVNIGISFIQIATSLERMGDYVKNICERVIYLTTGTILELS